MSRRLIGPHVFRRKNRPCWYAYLNRGKMFSTGTEDRDAAEAVLSSELKRIAEKRAGRPPSRRPKWNTVRQRVRRRGMRTGASCEVCGWSGPIPGATMLNAHHVIPLGCEGPDTEENLVLLCPNHHAIVHKAWPSRDRSYRGPTDKAAMVSALRAIDLGVLVESAFVAGCVPKMFTTQKT